VGDGVVECDGVGFVVPVNRDTVKRVDFNFGPVYGVVRIMVEVADIEEFKPRFRIRLGIVDQFEWGSEPAAKTARNLVNHGSSVITGMELELMTNLFFGDVSTRHLNDGTPCTLDQSI